MAKFAAKVANKALTMVAKKLVLTNCIWVCHREEAPDELYN